jgi:hypothetical protein
MEVYVQSFPSPGDRWQVSTTGGSQPRWRGDGADMYFVAGNGMLMAASLRTTALFAAQIISAQGACSATSTP